MEHKDYTNTKPETCPHCGAGLEHLVVREYDPVWHDGKVWCTECDKFVREWDAG